MNENTYFVKTQEVIDSLKSVVSTNVNISDDKYHTARGKLLLSFKEAKKYRESDFNLSDLLSYRKSKREIKLNTVSAASVKSYDKFLVNPMYRHYLIDYIRTEILDTKTSQVNYINAVSNLLAVNTGELATKTLSALSLATVNANYQKLALRFVLSDELLMFHDFEDYFVDYLEQRFIESLQSYITGVMIATFPAATGVSLGVIPNTYVVAKFLNSRLSNERLRGYKNVIAYSRDIYDRHIVTQDTTGNFICSYCTDEEDFVIISADNLPVDTYLTFNPAHVILEMRPTANFKIKEYATNNVNGTSVEVSVYVKLIIIPPMTNVAPLNAGFDGSYSTLASSLA